MILMAETTDTNQNATETRAAAKPRRRRAAPKKDTEVSVGEERSAEGAPAAQEKKVAQPAGEKKDNYSGVLVFGKYNPNEVAITDRSIEQYVNLKSYVYPNIYGRRKFQSYYASHISVVERLVNKLMRGGTGKKVGGKVIRTEGRLQGKKVKVMHIVQKSFDIVSKQTGKNPLQVLIDALQNSAPIEDTTRVRYGGISYNVAVGISAQRRINVALKNIALAALIGAFRNRRPLAEALANELVLAANNSPESYAIKKRVEGERIAKRAR